MEKTSTPTSTLTENKPQKLYQPMTPSKAKKIANELVKFAKDNRLTANIAGKDYLMVEGWQFVGSQSGLTQVVTKCEPVAPFDLDEKKPEVKYKAEVEIINQYGTVMSRGFAWCSDKEAKKKNFDEYAVASMAQTRAIGKAYRNILSWIVKIAGYEATPMEEIDRDNMEAELAKVKQEVLKALNAADFIKGVDVMAKIEEILGKRVIENIDDANTILRTLEEEAKSSDRPI